MRTSVLAAALALWGADAGAQTSPLPLPAPLSDLPRPPLFQPFKIDRSNRLAIEVAVNGQGPYYFIVDTGSERSVISDEIAESLSLEAGPPLSLATVAGRYIAPSFYVDRITTDTIALDALEAPALARRNIGAHGLIGLDGLDGHRVVMNFNEDRMTVERTGRKLPSGVAPDGTIVVNARKQNGRMVIHHAAINGISVDLILDTGTPTSIGNPALREKLLGRRSAKAATGFLHSVTGERIMATLALAENIEIGDATIRNLPISFADAYAFKALDLYDEPALLLGMDVIGLFGLVAIDFDKRQVQFSLPDGRRARSRSFAAARF